MGQGGDGGNIILNARKIQGGGKILADGGHGTTGGKGGIVQITSDDMSGFTGEISAKGGNALISKEDYEKIINELRIAIESKDKNSILKILTYAGDKSVDFLIAILAG